MIGSELPGHLHNHRMRNAHLCYCYGNLFFWNFLLSQRVVIGYSLILLLFGLGCRWRANLLQATWWKCRKTTFCMTILNCWYGTTKNWQISWGISFHTNASAATNGTIFPFQGYAVIQCYITSKSKFGSLWLGLTFQIENPLSCKSLKGWLVKYIQQQNFLRFMWYSNC